MATHSFMPTLAAETDRLSIARPDAELARVRTEFDLLAARLARLECAAAAAAADTGAGLVNEPAERQLQDEVAALTARLAEREHRLTEVEREANDKITALYDALSQIERSIAWRATKPIRAASAALPEPVRNGLYQVARYAYWAVTPHRMPQRLRSMSYMPLLRESVQRMHDLSEEARSRIGQPSCHAYGDTPVERLEIYRTTRPNAPVFIFIHGGAWREGEAKNYGFPAELFVNAGAHYVALDFAAIKEAGGDLRVMAEQVCRGVAWVCKNVAIFDGDPTRIYAGGHSSGAHLCAVALTTDWPSAAGLPPDIIKGGLLMSGVYDLSHVRESGRYSQVRFSSEMEDAMSPHRHVDRLPAPVIVSVGGNETPDFRQQARQFYVAAKTAGKAAELVDVANFGHMEMLESLLNPYGPNGRAALAMMGLGGAPP